MATDKAAYVPGELLLVEITLAGQTAFHQVTFQQAYSQPPLLLQIQTMNNEADAVPDRPR